MNIHQRHTGINFHPKPEINLWAPHARKLAIEIEGKETIVLNKKGRGFWHALPDNLQPGDRYKLRINEKDSFPDPASLSQPDGVHGASECIDLNTIKKIHDSNWQGVALKDLVIYELHTATFTPEGTFAGIAGKLDYLKDLGVNAIKILPIASFPGERNWGYDGAFPYAVQQSYGGPVEFAKLVKACHEKGIAVILDVVYNHLGPEGNYLGAFGPAFTGKYTTPWGKAINYDDAWCDGVRQFFLENALMWLRDFHVDGLRLDAVHAIKDFSPKHFLRELSEKVIELNRESGKNHFLIAECDLNDTRYIKPVEKDGYGMDAQWCDEWHHSLHALLTGEKNGYYTDFGTTEQLVKSFNHAYVFTGGYSPHRRKIFGTPTEGQPGERFVVFTQNHDQTGNRLMGDRLSALINFEPLKLAAGAMLMSPFVPMIFMGEEYAESNPFLYFISHGDDHLTEAVRKGRKREFRDFIKKANPPDPAAESTFNQSKLQWNFDGDKQKKQMLGFYTKLIAIRKEQALLRPGDRTNVSATLSDNKKAIILKHEGEKVSILTLMNFSEDTTTLSFEANQPQHPELLIYSAHQQWGGEAADNESPWKTNGGHAQITLHPWSVAISIQK
ncbi:MAG: malto-oligosyltrehalose trehalohydrolase [Bacteroidetes bacterium]|nr:MAG: malto-oligosyltrehalose trehalohydrolase [Bacteroidota bacterium]